MQKQLQLLRDLQALDTERKVVEVERQVGFKEQQALNAELERLQEMVDSLTDEMGALEKEQSELANAMALEQQNIERSEGRLPQIKTQKEYIAVLKEVDTAKKLAKELQDQIDAKNGTLASLGLEKSEKDDELAKAKQEASERCAAIEASLVSVIKQLDEMERQRKVLMEGLPTKLRKRYELLMSKRAGVAIVEARGGACLGCHMHLPPQMFNSLFVIKEIQSCPHCNRLLFVAAVD